MQFTEEQYKKAEEQGICRACLNCADFGCCENDKNEPCDGLVEQMDITIRIPKCDLEAMHNAGMNKKQIRQFKDSVIYGMYNKLSEDYGVEF